MLYPLSLISSASEITLIHGSEFAFHTIAKGGELSSLPMTVNGVFTIARGWITSTALTATNEGGFEVRISFTYSDFDGAKFPDTN